MKSLSTSKTMDISSKELEVIILLYRFRFLTLNLFQELLGHRNHERIRVWLNDLIKKNYIGKINTQKLPNVAAYYFLKTGAISILRDEKDISKPSLNKFYKKEEKSQKFIDHSLLIIDIYLKFKEQTKEGEIQFKTKIEMEKSDFLPKHLPDAYISIKEEKKKTKRYFLFYFDEGTPKGVINMKIREYVQYSNEDEWKENTGHLFPKILIVCPTYSMKIKLQKSVVRILEEEGVEDLPFYLTTKQDIQEKGSGQKVWKKVTSV